MIEDIILAARAGGEVINKYFGESLQLEEKSTLADFRTKADLESERVILEVLKEKFPDYNIFSEETGHIEKNSKFTLVIDPLDGTNNFVLGLPNFSVSIGLLEGDHCIAGVIHAPLLNQTYSAEIGRGAFCNEKKINVSREVLLEKATIAYTCGYINTPEFEIELLHKLRAKKIKRYLTNWSPAFDYCLLASGKIDAVINNKNELHDYAAGKIIAREAGATITTLEGTTQDDRETSLFLMTNGTALHQKLLQLIGQLR